MSKRSIRADLVDFLYTGENDGFAGKSEKILGLYTNKYRIFAKTFKPVTK